MQLFILGKTPLISLAELESLLGHESLAPRTSDVVEFGSDQFVELKNLGGVLKIGQIIDRQDFTSWEQTRKYLEQNYKNIIEPLPETKIKLGISLYGFGKLRPSEINATALTIKKRLKNDGFSCRVIPNKQETLNSAQVIHGKLLTSSGAEIIIVRTNNQVLFAKTTQVQDVDAYADRDQARPKRDATVGMLPPKLAQSIINLSGAESSKTLLDPFCGTGVLLQEALLMGVNVLGTDLEPRMIDYSKENLEWLKSRFDLHEQTIEVSQADATDHKWPTFDTIACETYLGRPLSSAPSNEVLAKIISDTNTIHRKFLENIAKQTKPGLRMCIAVPAWHTKNGFKHLPVLDSLDKLGYNRISFVLTGKNRLIYHRKDQFVARELVVIERI